MLDNLGGEKRASNYWPFFENQPENYELNGLYFHGVEPVDNALRILTEEQLVSSNRIEMNMDNAVNLPVIEDLLRLDEIGYRQPCLEFEEAIRKYEDKLLTEGSIATEEILEDDERRDTLSFLLQTRIVELDLSGRTYGT